MASILKLPEDSITEETSLKNCKQWTSKRHILITVAMEQEFGIEGQLTIDEIVQMVTVAKIKEILKKHL
jgi:acyl carrier protein